MFLCDDRVGDYGTLAFNYDGVGNRTTLARSTPSGTEIDTYVYPANSNRLTQAQIGGGTNRDMGYNASGNLIFNVRPDGDYDFVYDAAGRLIEVAKDGVVVGEYGYNIAGQMIWRKTPGTGEVIHIVHDHEGNRIAEYDATTGQVLIEYIWLNGEPIAAVSGGVTYYIRTDHIDRPAFATYATGAVASSISYKPFGEVHTSTGTDFGLRFPGQFYHWETALHQNWIRDYDPTTGRYIQGSHDGSHHHGDNACNHYGLGLSRRSGTPNRKDALPGGVIDSRGLHVPILDLDAPEETLGGFRGFMLEWGIGLFRTFEHRFTFGEPEQLTLDDMKARIIALNKKAKHMPKTWRKVEQAQSFDEVMLADIPPPVYEHYYGPVRVKNWVK
ncbi:MAG: hypothetical protein MK098_04865 [Marinovum sp.]|nr:hypothetical protein [Marinovum sp.]